MRHEVPEITAVFEGSCPACVRRIHVGDRIVREDDAWVHETCRGQDIEPRNPTCPHCFIQHAGDCV